jgi:hypothetical protein
LINPRKPIAESPSFADPVESGEMAAHPWPALIDDLIIEILLRLPPDDTACLTRASLVCKA